MSDFFGEKLIDDETLLRLQKQLDDRDVEITDLSDEEIDKLTIVYRKQTRELNSVLRNKKRHIVVLKNGEASLQELQKIDQLYSDEKYSEIGLSWFVNGEYLGTYLSYAEFMCDLAFFHSFADLEMCVDLFDYYGKDTQSPFRYRGEYCETQQDDKIIRYIHYSNTIQELISKFEIYEKREKKLCNTDACDAIGITIYLFDENYKRYSLWVDLAQVKSVVDIIHYARQNKLFVPSEAIDELSKTEEVEVFISHKSEDYLVSKKLYEYLLTCGIPTFLSEISLPAMSNSDYSFEIDKALEKAKNIIVVATSLENITSSWVQYEWTTFANEKRSGRKSGNIITIISDNLSIDELPLVLRQHEVIRLENYKEIINYFKAH